MKKTPGPPPGLLRVLRERGMDDEIEMLRQAQGLEPDQVKEWVAEYQKERLDPERAVRTAGMKEPVNLPQAAVDAIRANRPVEALRAMTESGMFDLKRSRRLLDAYCRQNGLPPPFSGRAVVLKAIVGVIASAAAAYAWHRLSG